MRRRATYAVVRQTGADGMQIGQLRGEVVAEILGEVVGPIEEPDTLEFVEGTLDVHVRDPRRQGVVRRHQIARERGK